MEETDFTVSADEISAIGEVLVDPNRALKERFRALFTLKNIGGQLAVDCIAKAFNDPSALLKHELAYCLGQMQEEYAVPFLIEILKDPKQEPMVRHEAGEALGAIGKRDVIDVLKEYAEDPVPEVAETCHLALNRIKWLQEKPTEGKDNSPYASVDPAPADTSKNVEELKRLLLNGKASLFERYRAMFALRNLGNEDAIDALGESLDCPGSALFRHEVAFVFGQMQNARSVPYLIKKLRSMDESEMVRHECAEALGSIATEECHEILKEYLKDEKRVVRESCEIALDICDYEQSGEFQYADKLLTLRA